MCRTIAPAECPCGDEPSTPRTTVRLLADTGLPDVEVRSTISSRAVSGSMTIPKTSLAASVMPPNREEAELTGKIVAPEVTVPVSVVCCDSEVYLRVVIYLPIDCSEHGLDTGVFA